MAYQHISNGVKFAWLAGSLGAGCVMMYPHTFGLQQHRDLITSHTHGKPDVVDAEILLLAEQIKKDLKWTTSTIMPGTLLSLVQTTSFEFCNHGSTNTRWGGLIGVPAFFASKALKAAEEDPQFLLKYNIDLDSERGKRLFETFKLSPAAKKFALAREMCDVKSQKLFVNSIGMSFTIISSFVLAATLSQKLRFRGAGMLSYITIIPTATLVAIKASDIYNCHHEAKIDKQAAKIDLDVGQGGVEYYTALIERRNALEDSQAKLSSNTGLSAVLDKPWRKPHLSLDERKSLLQEELKKLYPQGDILPS